MKKLFKSLFLSLLLMFSISISVWADYQPTQNQDIDPKEIIERGKYLKNIINNLLLSPNVNSIQEATKNTQNNAQIKELIDKALEKKLLGEKLFDEKNYLEALVNFQSSLEYILQAIKETKNLDDQEKRARSEIKEKLKSNDFFLSTATKIIEEEKTPSEEPRRLLEKAREAKAKAEAKINEGKMSEALEALETSTSLAERAIIWVRDGKTIERRPRQGTGELAHPDR
ncbi:MAG: hypothetical protein HYY20_14235 [Candidatus Tectomicrobia bacterium]|uniref:DUF5667 domain-containing protein n=1 Tax=Tectimicrobiota bacterium TaxID=2528274 RepID=A0A932CRX9_UNCTE|nr:hypothetical protein [Candidatus Tectomicrobia bacterium]